MELLAGREWRQDHCLSLAGVYKPRQNIEGSSLPAALVQYLKDYPEIRTVTLHLDNDEPGRLAARAIIEKLADDYIVENNPPCYGKDYNELLQMRLGIKTCAKQLKYLER